MITVKTLPLKEIAKEAMRANSFIADSPDGIRVIYEKCDKGYLFIMQKGTGKITEKPTLISAKAFCNGLHTCCREKWAMQVYATRRVITWK